MLNTYRKLLEMMLPRERTRFWILVGVTFFLSLMEVASVISILPFLRLLSEPSLIETNDWLAWAYATGGFSSSLSFLIWVGVVVLFVTVLGLVLKTVSIWLTTRFALMRSYSFSARLLSTYLHQPYEWFLARHSSELGNAILSEVDRVVVDALLPAVRLIPQVFTVVLLVVALCFLEPQIAIGGAVLIGGVYGAIYFLVRRVMTRIGAIRMEANRIRFHVVQEATGGLKELKIMGLESGFLGRFRIAALRMARAQTRGQVIINVPRQVIEAVAFGGILLLILFLLARDGGDISALVPTLGLVAAAGLRLIPAMQEVFRRGASIRQSAAPLARIHGDLTGLPAADPEALRAANKEPKLHLTEALEMDAVQYSYPETNRAALDKISLKIEARKTIGIVGGTGAGKTTFVDIILGLLAPESGEMRVDGRTVTPENRRAWQKTLGYVPQVIFISEGTIAENIAFGVPEDEIDMAAVERAARIAALHDFVEAELPDGYSTTVGERGVRLSGGQRQRIGIARALYSDPTTLLFDEATSALDTLTEAAVMEAVQKIAGQKTILMIAHRLSTVRHCDTIFLMRHGRVEASGTFDELVEKNEEFRRMAVDLR
ncbi:MAG: ABC transporter ATP-binding protein [Pseudomonadota bacterium]